MKVVLLAGGLGSRLAEKLKSNLNLWLKLSIPIIEHIIIGT